jgi:hypothetical protein
MHDILLFIKFEVIKIIKIRVKYLSLINRNFRVLWLLRIIWKSIVFTEEKNSHPWLKNLVSRTWTWWKVLCQVWNKHLKMYLKIQFYYTLPYPCWLVYTYILNAWASSSHSASLYSCNWTTIVRQSSKIYIFFSKSMTCKLVNLRETFRNCFVL